MPTDSNSSFTDPSNYNETIHLHAPTLNISQYKSTNWKSTANISAYRYTNNNVTMNATYVSQNGICSPEQSYQWGFSGLLLFFAIFLTTIWAFGMWSMWIDAHYQSKLALHGRRLGSYRAALDISLVLRRECLDNESKDVDRLSDDAIRQKLHTGKHRTTISYAHLITEKATSNRATRPVRWVEWKGWSWMQRQLG